MLNLLLFIMVLFVSFVAVRIGAIAFHLTGLDWSLAKFQALSCFSGTGFTTRESELVVGHPQRRKIASILMVLGNAGLVTLIATVVGSLRPRQWKMPFLRAIPEDLIPWISLIGIIAGVYALYRFMNSKAAYHLTSLLKRKLMAHQEQARAVSFEELTISTGGYGVVRMRVCPNSPILNKSILQSGLKDQGILLLAVVRQEQTMPNPAVSTVIRENDELICFGRTDEIRQTACFQPATTTPSNGTKENDMEIDP